MSYTIFYEIYEKFMRSYEHNPGFISDFGASDSRPPTFISSITANKFNFVLFVYFPTYVRILAQVHSLHLLVY